MRVRSNRAPSETRRRDSLLRRRHGATPRSQPVDVSVDERDDLADERRMRESGGPDDRAVYTCTCGYVFEADVSTSVTCPHCGSAQAW
jgi:hypothetical protein